MGAWKFDPMHTQVEFSAKGLGLLTVRGGFAEVVAGGELDVERPQDSRVEAEIKSGSIRTRNKLRDRDLRSSNFLAVDQFPTMSFKSTKIESRGGDRYSMTGDVTIKGVTKPITLEVVTRNEFNDDSMGRRIGFTAYGQLNRRDFGVAFAPPFVVRDEIQIKIEGRLLEVKEPAAAAVNLWPASVL